MAGPITGITGSISWTGVENAYLATTGNEPAKFTINFEGEEFDTTTFLTTGSESAIKGLTSLTGEVEAMLKSPDHGGGSNGLITFAAGTVLNSDEWEMDIVRREYRVTAFQATAHAYIPGTWSAGGRFGGFIDDTTAIAAISNASEPANATFKYQEKGASDNAITASIFTSAGTAEAGPLMANRYSYTYKTSGDINFIAPSTGASIMPSSVSPGTPIAGSAAGSLVLTASTGRSFTTNAFWTNINIRVTATGLTVVRWRFRSSDGSLAIA